MSRSSKANILVVDDEPHSLFALQQLLGDPDYNVIAVSSGKEALRQILISDFALVLLDVRMPEMDGFEVAKFIRQLKRSRQTPIIFLTAAFKDTESVFRGYEIGVVDYIMKPVDATVLQSKVAVFVALYNKSVDLSTQVTRRTSEQRELSRLAEDLETKIRERTATLIKANEQLRREVTMREFAEENLRKSELELKKLALVASRTENAVIIKDAANRIEWVNESFTRIYGYTLEEAKSKEAGVLLNGGPVSLAQLAVGAHAGNDGTDSTLVLRHGKNGRDCWLTVEGYTITDDDGTVTGYLEIDSDITERRRAEEELHRAMQAAEAASQAKSEFLANMSHEIRTPMNAIIGMTDLALQTALTTEQREYLGLVKSSGLTLLNIIKDILDFSKIEAGCLELEAIPFSLRECVGDTVRTLAFDAQKKGLELAYEIAPDMPDALIGDPVRLGQVIINLVGNAIKFTDRGEVVLTIRQQSRNPSDITCHFAVRDSGPGIPKEKQESIFAPFLQADSSTTRLYGGTGLGLAITSHLVKLMNGEIWLDSEPGVGSTFYFTLRFDQQSVSQQQWDAIDFKGISMLVVEDHSVGRRFLVDTLRQWGIGVREAPDGRTAMERISRMNESGEPYSLVLLDDSLPDEDSYALAGRIQQMLGSPGRVVMLGSASRANGNGVLGAASGFACMTKPVKLSELLGVVYSASRRLAGSPAYAASRTAVMANEAKRNLDILLVEDNPVNRRLAHLVLEREGHHVTVADNGAAALDVLRCAGFDLVLMDVQMPGMDGIEATGAIRDKERASGEHIPIIALTAHATVHDRERCLRAGMDGYLTKPIQPEKLLDAIRHVRDVRPKVSQALLTGNGLLDREALLEQVDGDMKVLGEITELFMRDCDKHMAGARDAAKRRDRDRLAYLLHTLRGMFSNLFAHGAQEATSMLQNLLAAGEMEQVEAAFAQLEQQVELFKAELLHMAEGVPA